MYRFVVCLIGMVACGFVNPSLAAEPGNVVEIEAFVRNDKPSAAEVADYLAALSRRVPGLKISTHDVIKDRSQLARLYELTKKTGRSKPVVPAFHSCGRLYFGFENEKQSGPAIEDLFTADVYTRNTCPRCRDAKEFIAKLRLRWPAIRFRIHEVTNDSNARARWQALCTGSGSTPGLPTFDFGNHVIIGYQGDDITGKQYEQLIQRKASIEYEKPVAKPPRSDSSFQQMLPLGFPVSVVSVLGVEDGGDAEDELELPDEASEMETGEATVKPTTPVETSVSETIDVPVFGKLRVGDLGMPLFTFLVGLVDGFNPCAMWILVFLLSVLVNIKDRRKIVIIAGTFVFVSGLAYFAFMAAWLNLFLLIGIVRPVQIVLGLLALFIGIVNVKDFVAFKKGISLSIPEKQKPALYRRVRKIVDAEYLTVALVGAMVLAVVVNMIELLCTAGLPALYTQILTMQEYPAWKNYGYLALYISAYMLDDTVLVVIVVATLSHRKLQEREGRWLKLLSGIVILALGLVMLLRPSWLHLQS
ncbi:MAG: hypothetical protein HKN47_10905 [Pirellulaceae bacterium]|nr:hypothetical protein [Pirellulaceae bacterium]